MPQCQVFLYAMWFEYVVQTYILLNTSNLKLSELKMVSHTRLILDGRMQGQFKLKADALPDISLSFRCIKT